MGEIYPDTEYLKGKTKMWKWLKDTCTSDVAEAYKERDKSWRLKDVAELERDVAKTQADTYEKRAIAAGLELVRERHHCDDLRKSMSSLQLHYDTLTGGSKELRDRLKSSTADAVMLRATVESLKASTDRLINEVAVLETARENTVERNTLLSGQLDKLRESSVKDRGNLSNATAIVENMQLVNREQIVEINDGYETIRGQAVAIVDLKKEVQVSRDIIEKHEVDKRALKSYVDELKTIIRGNAETLTKLETREKMTQESSRVWKEQINELTRDKAKYIERINDQNETLEAVKGLIEVASF